MSKIYPELQEHLIAIQDNLEQLSKGWEKEPPVALKGKVMEAIRSSNSVQKSIEMRKAKIIQMRKKEGTDGINKKSVAAVAVILILGAAGLLFVRNIELGKVEDKLATLQDEIKSNQALVADLNAKVEQNVIKEAFITDDRTLTIALAGTDLSPEAKVKAYWNKNDGEVMLVGMNLPSHEITKQYQLWAIVDGVPVDLGMLDENNPNESLTKKVAAGDVQAFAITLENKGGSPTPNLEQLFVIGNVKA